MGKGRRVGRVELLGRSLFGVSKEIMRCFASHHALLSFTPCVAFLHIMSYFPQKHT